MDKFKEPYPIYKYSSVPWKYWHVFQPEPSVLLLVGCVGSVCTSLCTQPRSVFFLNYACWHENLKPWTVVFIHVLNFPQKCEILSKGKMKESGRYHLKKAKAKSFFVWNSSLPSYRWVLVCLWNYKVNFSEIF